MFVPQILDNAPPRSLSGLRVLLVAAVCAGGCASHSQSMLEVREDLMAGQTEAAYRKFSEKKKSPDDLLYLMECGYLAHEAGEYDSSNAAFDAAELRIEELYTKSVSGELLSIVTSDNTLPYRGYPHELTLIHYYRAFNYLLLGLREDALVEARKANQRLAELADEKEGQATYKNDAFMQFFTAMLYESEGEYNDAVVAYRDAYRTYDDYATLYGTLPPPGLSSDLYAALQRIGAVDETAALLERSPSIEVEMSMRMKANAIVFVETGFTPYLEAVDIVLPVFEDRDANFRNCNGCADDYANVLVSRYGDDIYSWRHKDLELDHVLKFSFPMMVDFPTEAYTVAVECSLEQGSTPVVVEPVDAVVKHTFEERLPKLLLKTVARALVKEFARSQAKKQDEALGTLVNLINVATERADTRSCLFFPHSIWMIQLELPPGKHHLNVAVHGVNDAVLERIPVTVEVPEDGIAFARARSFR